LSDGSPYPFLDEFYDPEFQVEALFFHINHFTDGYFVRGLYRTLANSYPTGFAGGGGNGSRFEDPHAPQPFVNTYFVHGLS
jgi:hypothetical protein